MNRRLFLAGILAAPAIVRASSLMPIFVRKPNIWTPPYLNEPDVRFFEPIKMLHDDTLLTEHHFTASEEVLTIAMVRDMMRNATPMGDSDILIPRPAKILAPPELE